MKIKEIFKPIGPSETFDGSAPFLDYNNCQVENLSKKEDCILLHLKRESDNQTGQAYMRVQDKFKILAGEFLNWAFVNKKIIGLTLNQLQDLETKLEVENLEGRLTLKFNS